MKTFPLAAVVVAARSFVPSQEPNMNGKYMMASTPNGKPKLFPEQFRDYPGGVEYFEVYSGEITTRYSQVWWSPLNPVDLPNDIVERYKGRGMAIVGFEVDQVRVLEDGSEVSVPISASYNHHYATVMVGEGAQFVQTNFTGPFDPRIKQAYGGKMPSHGLPWDQPQWIVQDKEPKSADGLPTSHLFDGGNGGEYRMSFHGVAPGHALVIGSPTQLQVTPMQIDTWNREAMDISTGVYAPFVPGPLPRESQAPPGAMYSGLLECPLTTRITKLVDSAFKAQGSGQCSTPITTAQACWAAANAVGGGSLGKLVNQTINHPNKPGGCSVSEHQSTMFVYWNTAQSPVACAANAAQLTAAVQSLVKVSLAVHVTQATVTITLTGPSTVWFGVGFGAGKMEDQPWAIVVDGNGTVKEHQLADHDAGVVLKPSVTVVKHTVDAGLRTVVLTRPLKGVSAQYYTFDPFAADETIEIINAIGSGPVFGYHKDKKSAFLTLVPNGDVAGVCICEISIPFGKGTGTIIYNANSSDPNDIGSGSAGFSKVGMCPPLPRSVMLDQKNPTCDIRTYVGGMWTCHHMWSLLDADQEIPWADKPLVFQHKYRFWVQEYNSSYHTGLERRDNWGLGADIELDIPKCGEGVPGCSRDPDGTWVHTVYGAFRTDGTLGALHFHCHAPACLNMTLYGCPKETDPADCNATTGKLMCNQTPVYGNGKAQKYQEPEYLLLPPCLWGKPEHGLEPPPRLEDYTLFLIKSTNATVGHLGEMATAQVYTYPPVF